MGMFNKEEEEQLKEIESQLKGLGYELVAYTVKRGKRVTKISIVIYNKQGISHNDCVLATRKLTPYLDKHFGENYGLEVSSPGLGRVLKSDREYQIFANEPVQLYYKEPEHNKSITIIQGILLEKNEDCITLLVEDKEQEFPMDRVKKTKLAS